MSRYKIINTFHSKRSALNDRRNPNNFLFVILPCIHWKNFKRDFSAQSARRWLCSNEKKYHKAEKTIVILCAWLVFIYCYYAYRRSQVSTISTTIFLYLVLNDSRSNENEIQIHIKSIKWIFIFFILLYFD